MSLFTHILLQYSDEWVFFRSVRIPPKDIPHTSMLFLVAEVEGKTVGPPIEVPPLSPYKLLHRIRVELNQFGTIPMAGRVHRHSHWPSIYFRNPYPWRCDMPTWLLNLDLARKEVSCYPDMGHLDVTNEAFVENQGQAREDQDQSDRPVPKKRPESFHLLFSFSTTFVMGVEESPLSSLTTVRNGQFFPPSVANA